MPYRSSSQQYPPSPYNQNSRRSLRPLYPATDVTPTIDPSVLTATGTQWQDASFNEHVFYGDHALDINDPYHDLFSALCGTSTTGPGQLTDDAFSQHFSSPEQPVTGFLDAAEPTYTQRFQHHGAPVSAGAYELCRRQRLELAHEYPTQTSPLLRRAVPSSPACSSNSSNSTSLFVCNICGVETKRKKDMDRHKNTQHGNTSFRCKVCEFVKKRGDRLRASCLIRHPTLAPRIEKIIVDE